MVRDRYLESIVGLAIPTEEQTAEFASFVFGAHSWYKHLPASEPGAPFAFFLDPNAGRDEVVLPNGRIEHRDRVGEKGFHYTWMTTAEYRARFGHWSYASDRGTTFLVRPPGDPETLRVSVPRAWISAANGDLVPVSPDLLAVGTVNLTAHVHEKFIPGMVMWLATSYQRFMADGARSVTATESAWHREMKARVELWERHKDDIPVFERLLEEERSRLRAEVLATLHRVRAWLNRR